MIKIVENYLSEIIGLSLGVLIVILVWYLYGSYIRRTCCCCVKSNDSNA
ncbi:hypothetical protein ISN44_As02g035110 [Arabidopsis suecica]|uniref:Uncharacterized protein n=1 Tax=Arabidopsis suecica TaxID=45249 RepID=A0A8T2G8J8_ARASU|nr:hypothetical protein ISN44_As02g035110 [Arabidopsis suecica]